MTTHVRYFFFLCNNTHFMLSEMKRFLYDTGNKYVQKFHWVKISFFVIFIVLQNCKLFLSFSLWEINENKWNCQKLHTRYLYAASGDITVS